jgi:hypothetical protein
MTQHTGPADILTRLRVARRNGLGVDFCDQSIAEIERLRSDVALHREALCAANRRGDYWTEQAAEAQAEIERLRAECQTQPCGHAERWLAYKNPVDAGSERYCVFCEVARLRGENDWLAEQLDDVTSVSTRLRDELASVRQHEAGTVEAVRLQEVETELERLRAECKTQPCGHAERWLAYKNPVDAGSEQYCVFCEMERLRAIVDRLPKTADTLMACHDVIRDLLAMRQGRPTAMVGSRRLEQLSKDAREAAEKARGECQH